MTDVLERALIGGGLAIVITTVARRARSLSSSGAVAAVLIGTVAAAAAWLWAIVLIAYFAASTALSHWGRAEKERRTRGVISKGGERDAIQVFANGGVFAIAAFAMLLHTDVRWLALGAGALAASAADTWATEIGTLFGGAPRSIISLRPVAPGMSGGITAEGTFAALIGSLFIGVIAYLLGAARIVAVAAIIGGFAGAIVDSLLGGTLQLRRWCPSCERATERGVHDCGASTVRHGGVRWLNNDAVNFVCTVAGGLLSAWIAR